MDVGPEPKEKLAEILNKPLTPENIQTYFDDAFDETANLAEKVRKTYEHIHPHPRSSDAQIEDMAFAHFGLRSIPEVLETIIKKRDEVVQVSHWLDTHTDTMRKVIVPTRSRSEIRRTDSPEEMEKLNVLGRVQTLLFILKDAGVDLDELRVIKGEMDDSMMRKVSYVLVDAPSINRSALVCDEAGNASYIFDRSRLQTAFPDIDTVVQLKKDELNELLVKSPDSGRRYVYSPHWVERTRALLLDEFVAQETREADADKKDIPFVSRSELDPWRNFYLDEQGVHWGALENIAERLGIGQTVLGRICDENNVLKRKGVSSRGSVFEMYPYETLALLSRDLSELPQVEKEGPWRGFLLDGGLHWGALNSISVRIEMDFKTLREKVETNGTISSKRIRNAKGRVVDAYPLEQVKKLYEDVISLSIPIDQADSEWNGFVFRDKLHWATGTALSEKLSISRRTIDQIIRSHNISPIKIRGTRSYVERDAFPYETIRHILDERRSQSVAQEGLWRGFLEKDGGHWGTASAIADKLDVHEIVVRNRLTNATASIKGFDLAGKESPLYSFEQFDAMLRSFIALPNPIEDGEWKGFIERDGEYWGPIVAIATRLAEDNKDSRGRIERSIKKIIAENSNLFPYEKARSLSGRETIAYRYADVEKAFRQK